MLQQATLDEIWDFDDAALSEERLRVELEQGGPYDEVERAELKSQLARAYGLQDRFDDAAELLIEIEAQEAPVVIVRILLESGRILNSAGKPEDAAPLFLRSAQLAGEHNLPFLRIDALHMLAISTPSNAEHWTAQGVELAEASDDPRTQRWLISLHNNLGWNRLDSGDTPAAIAEFTEAVRWAELVGTAQQKQWAAESLAEASAL
jgi:tetratricopeptide (TPR) repeat protein